MRFVYEMLVATIGLFTLYCLAGIVWVLWTSLVG